MKDFQFITGSHPAYIENLYNDYLKDPASVDPELKKFFEGFDYAVSNVSGSLPVASSYGTASKTGLNKELAVYSLIMAYKQRGHLLADINPLHKRKDLNADLSLGAFNLSDNDLKESFESGTVIGLKNATLQQIVQKLQSLYCGKVGIEYAYINDKEKLAFIEDAIQNTLHAPVPVEQKKHILQKLNEGVMFEKFLHTKYVGQKRFSLEGGENTITALDAIIQTAATDGVEEIVFGMAHRGRLNVLANIMGKTYEQIFKEFEGDAPPDTTMGSGDVKYHLGFSSEVIAQNGRKVNLKLTPNPSHLEAVAPVVLGFVRSKGDILYRQDYGKIMPVILHGDASVAGQGVVYEVLQMSKLRGYYVGGTIHFVINNQIGFTTDLDDARSAVYCTSVASMIEAPVFHVNGDDAEAVVKVAQIAAAYRNKFKSDVFIDMVCYRRHGHNEGDEPKFTQPEMYSLIEKQPNPREMYTRFLIENGEADAQELAKEMEKKFVAELQDRLDEVKQNKLPYTYQPPEIWWQSLRKATPEDFVSSPDTAITNDELLRYFNDLMSIPENFKPLRKVDKLLQDKIKLFNAEGKIDWATGELLAYASLLADKKIVRMSGQDVKRGTFSHRHAVIYDENNNTEYNRVNNVTKHPDELFRVYNSLLSEFAVLAFEYGYAMANPNSLVLWEAQFGDFANGAQTITDQFIAAAEQKWQRMNGMVMLLPHGYEGQGPEHSSARMERFLQQSAELNMVITNVTTASNFFHVLRRQLAWPFRKPLVNFSPKANLRHPESYSKVDEFISGGFKEVFDDTHVVSDQVTKVLFCSGKVYFDLDAKRKKEERNDIAIIRLEQIHPLPQQQLDALYVKYSKAVWYWVQEEPLNMGAAAFLRMNLNNINFHIVSRKARASVASGFAKVHTIEQEELLNTAFNI